MPCRLVVSYAPAYTDVHVPVNRTVVGRPYAVGPRHGSWKAPRAASAVRRGKEPGTLPATASTNHAL